jgi:hypothetical protein
LCIKLEMNQGYILRCTVNQSWRYIQQDATLHSLFMSGNCSTYFGWYLHPSSGAHTTVSTESGICHTVVGSSNSSTIAAGSSNSVTNTRCRRYSCMRSWWWVGVSPETCERFPDINKLCKVASCWIYIGIYLLVLPSWRIYIYWNVFTRFTILLDILEFIYSFYHLVGYIGIYLLILPSCWIYWNLFTRFTCAVIV